MTSLLDAVMVNCLFSQGIVAMNAEMTAHVTQGTRMLARATAKFLEVPDATANFDSETLAIQAGKTKARP